MWFIVALLICLTEARYNTRLVEPGHDCSSESYTAGAAVLVSIRPNSGKYKCRLDFTSAFQREADGYDRRLLFSEKYHVPFVVVEPCWSVLITIANETAIADYKCTSGSPVSRIWDSTIADLTVETLISNATSKDLLRFTLTPAVVQKDNKCPTDFFRSTEPGFGNLCVHDDLHCDGYQNFVNGTDEAHSYCSTVRKINSPATVNKRTFIIVILVVGFVAICLLIGAVLGYRYLRLIPKVRRCHDERDNLQVQFDNTKREKDENKQRVTDLENQLLIVDGKGKDQAVEKENKFTEVKKQLETAENGNAQLEKKVEKLQAEFSKAQEDLKRKDRELAKKEEQLDRNEKELSRARTERDNITNQLEQEQSKSQDDETRVMQKESDTERALKRVDHAEYCLDMPEKVMIEEIGQSRDDWGPVEMCSRSGFWCWKLSSRFEDTQEWGKMLGPSGGGILRSVPVILPVRLGRWKLILELRRDPGSTEMLLVVGLPPRDPYNKGLCGTSAGRGALLEVPISVSASLHHPETGLRLSLIPRNSGSVQGWPNWFRAGVIKVEGLFPAAPPQIDVFFDKYAGPALIK